MGGDVFTMVEWSESTVKCMDVARNFAFEFSLYDYM